MTEKSSATSVFLRLNSSTPDGTPYPERFVAAAGNTGNLMYESAVQNQLANVNIVAGDRHLPDEIECLIVALSNVLNPFCDLEKLTRAIESRNVRQLVVIGIGAQANDWDDEVTLLPATERFLRIASERSVTIGVRGDFTAELLRSWGIQNAEVIGCPSAFDTKGTIHPVIKNDLPWAPKVAVHTTMMGIFRDKVSMLLAHGQRHGADYIVQSEDWLMPLIEDPTADHDDFEHLLYFAVPFISYHVLRKWLALHGRVFFDADEFREAMRDYDFVYGMRFHGNMAALQAGIPALNLVFDTRTRELCEYLNLPTIELSQLSCDVSLQEVYDQADYSLFNATYWIKRNRYIAFLERQGLSHVMQPTTDPSQHAGNHRVSTSNVVRTATVSRLVRDMCAAGYRGDRLERELRARVLPFRTRQDATHAEAGQFAQMLRAAH